LNLLRELSEKPWTTPQGPRADVATLPSATIGLRLFLGVVTVLFSLLTVAYGERMSYEEWRPLPDSWLMWLNIAVLVGASVALQWARVSARRGDLLGVRQGLTAGGFFTFAFLGGQIWAWQQLSGYDFIATTSPANAFFYLITALHGLHLLGGLVAWGVTTERVFRGAPLAKIRLSINLCAVYWHYLLGVWLALFVLLFLPGGALPIVCRAFTP